MLSVTEQVISLLSATPLPEDAEEQLTKLEKEATPTERLEFPDWWEALVFRQLKENPPSAI
jgi:hypothetical protein